jgi:hypothetical protein
MKKLTVEDIHNVINIVERPSNILNVIQEENIITISAAGVTGKSGTSGTSGIAGTSGISGIDGTSGTSGLLLLSGSTVNGIITLSEFSESIANVNSNLLFDGNTLSVFGNIDIRTTSDMDGIIINDSTIKFSNDNLVVGIITSSNEGMLINGTLFGDSYVSGNFQGLGDGLFFNRVGTNTKNNSVMIIGNYYSDDELTEYDFKQTTIFKNGNIIVSGSIEIAESGYLLLNPVDSSLITEDSVGGMYYSTDGFYYLLSPI